MRWRQLFESFDWVLAGASVLLVLLGLGMMISANSGQSLFSGLVLRQLIALGVSIIGYIAIARIPYHLWQRLAPVVYGVGIAGLIIVTVAGQVIRGTVSRLEFFGWQLQPSELMKIALAVFLAWLLARYRTVKIRAAVLSGIAMAIPVALVLAEPDAGMAGLMIFTWAGVLLFAGLPWRHMVVVALIGVAVAGGAWQWALLDYQKDRIRTFVNPQENPLSTGYNIAQSTIAFGSGQFLGRGLGHGPQSQLKFLPERHTDFILASLGEELGFIGTALVVILYVVLLWRILGVARFTNDPFGQLLAIGIFFVILAGFTVSAGMNIGLLPVTGIPLPLVSYGGSNLLATFLLLGVIQSIRTYSRFVQRGPVEISGIS